MLNSTLKYRISLNQVIIFVFLLINIGLYYGQYANLVSLSYVFLFLGFIIQWNKKNRIKYIEFILYSLSFLFLAFLSIVWSFNPDDTISFVILLSKSIFISIIFLQLIENKKDLDIAFFGAGLGSLVYILIYISFIDFDNLGAGRLQSFNDEIEYIPNLNLVGIVGSFSFVYFLFTYFLSKKKLFIILAIISFVSVALLGSRKSILVMIFAVILLFPKLSLKFRLILTSLVSLILISISYVIPPDYLDFIINRFMNVLDSNTVDASDEHRLEILYNSLNFIELNPFIGSGYYNFSALNYNYYGSNLYSHNNFIETIVGLGLLGFILFYYGFYYIFKKMISLGSYESKLYFILFLTFFLNHYFIVVSNEKFMWLVVALFFAYIKLNIKNERKA